MAAKPELLSALRSVRSSGFLRIVSEFYDSTKVDISSRENEINIINHYYNSPKSEMVAVYGRRRVGKTFLIKETMGEYFDFEFVGMHKTSAKVQREQFQKEINRLTKEKHTSPTNWFDAFDNLKDYLLSLNKKKVVVFL